MKSILAFLLCLAPTLLSAHHQSCSGYKDVGSTAKVTSASPEEDYYDVQYLHFNLNMVNTSTAISGDVTTRAKVQVSSMPVYTFELNNQLSIDSFKFNGVITTVTGTGSIRSVTLPVALSLGDQFSAQVFYHGAPTTGTGFFTRGLNYIRLPSGTNLMYTLSDRFTAEDWWPCKQNLQDKIDSADIWITVPDSLRAGSNGLLTSVTYLPGSMVRYEWKTRYAIDYYLLSVSVAPYSDYSYYMHFTDGSGDSMLVQNYVYDSASYMTADRKAALDSTGMIVDQFSKLFGRYPFYKEKYGHCIAEPLGGGMEHQTMTTLAYAKATLIAHELGHQWFGDHVTYGSWSDIWLSEGFASYCEQLFQEHFHSAADLLNYRTDVFNRVMTGPGSSGGSVYVYDTVSTARVFSSRLTYDKGAAVAHMLRYMAPHDSLYFKALRTYQQQYAFGSAFTSDLQNIAEITYGRDLDTFFNQWIYKEGYPVYSVRWFQSGSRFLLELTQTTSAPASVACFAMPVQIKLQSPAGDTVLTVYNNKPLQSFEWAIGKTISGIQIDPDNQILNREGLITNDPSLGIAGPSAPSLVIAPNPTAYGWTLSNLPANATLQLLDLNGKLLWQGSAKGNACYIPAHDYAPGNYILSVCMKGAAPLNYKLMKQ